MQYLNFRKKIILSRVLFAILLFANLFFPPIFRHLSMFFKGEYVGYFSYIVYTFFVFTMPMFFYSFKIKVVKLNFIDANAFIYAGFENYYLIIDNKIVDKKSQLLKVNSIYLNTKINYDNFIVEITPNYTIKILKNKIYLDIEIK